MKVKQYERVLEVIRNAAPEAVTKETLAEELKDSGVEFYRLPTYIWEIKHKANVELESVKDGRRVVAYRLSVKTHKSKNSPAMGAAPPVADSVSDSVPAVAAN